MIKKIGKGNSLVSQISNKKSKYERFSLKQIQLLKSEFHKNPYPNKEKLQQLEEVLQQNETKISTWFKHYRQIQYKKGQFPQQEKKWFAGKEEKFLMKKFLECQRPTHENYLKFANKVKSSLKHVKNWFANNRRKCLKANIILTPNNPKPEMKEIILQGSFPSSDPLITQNENNFQNLKRASFKAISDSLLVKIENQENQNEITVKNNDFLSNNKELMQNLFEQFNNNFHQSIMQNQLLRYKVNHNSMNYHEQLQKLNQTYTIYKHLF